MQIALSGFLEFKAPEFMEALWKLLVSAQDSVAGIPQEFMDQKKEEIRQKRVSFTCGKVFNATNSIIIVVFQLETERVTAELKKRREREELERADAIKKVCC